MTPFISTYLFCLCAGPFKEYVDKNPLEGIPMSIFCRASLYEYLEIQSNEIFEITKQSIRYYEKFFGYKFPFSKYDYVFCPEYIFGAMENPGVITVNDKYIWRGDVSVDQRMWMGIILTHELAHMWFGNLVTMNWWDDLWLNESFADFVCFYCLGACKLEPPMLDANLFWNKRKNWGYTADQAPTTHPIAGEVPDTEAAQSIFDGITYSKGAATMKQLLVRLGFDVFAAAMKSYFHKYEWKNTVLQDLLDEMNAASIAHYGAEASKENPLVDIDLFLKEWIQTSGMNVVHPIWDIKSTKAEDKLTVIQDVCLKEHPTLRWHSLRIAFFNAQGDVCEEQQITLKNERET